MWEDLGCKEGCRIVDKAYYEMCGRELGWM